MQVLFFIKNHLISLNGISPCPERVRAIRDMVAPWNVTELKRFVGMVNNLGRFLPNLSTVMHPLSDLLKSDVTWIWDHEQEEGFKKVKAMLTETPVLAFYDARKQWDWSRHIPEVWRWDKTVCFRLKDPHRSWDQICTARERMSWFCLGMREIREIRRLDFSPFNF